MLAEGFNGSTGIKEVRDKSQLKACWKNLKAKAKKDAADERSGMFKTGGEPPPMITMEARFRHVKEKKCRLSISLF